MQEEFSHIEIIEDEPVEIVKEEKPVILEKLSDLEGWKKDAKKIGYCLIVIAAIIAGAWAIKKLSLSWGLRFHAPIEIISYQRHVQSNPNFSFVFSKKYLFDGDDQKKYGADYLAGFHIQNDQRTGCDVRKTNIGLNFAKSDLEINDAISKDLSAHVKGFANYSGTRIKIDNQAAMRTEFLLTDPLDNTLHIVQVMVSNGGQNYLLVCGSGESQYEFYKKDFETFLDSFSWNK